MAARAISSGTISFGLVTIPFKVFTATSPKSVSFNMLHKNCGSRLKQKLHCPNHDDAIVEREDTVRGYEYMRDQYVTFTEEELKKMEAAHTGALVLEQFLPAGAVDRLYIEKTYFTGPDKGADRSYQLLHRALEKKGAAGLGRFAQRGKDNLVLIAPSADGLMLHQLYYADEVRSFKDVECGSPCEFKEVELGLAVTLIDQMWTDKFEPARFRDERADAVKRAADAKIDGKEVAIDQPVVKKNVIDLLKALQESVAANAAQLGATKGPRKASPRRSKKSSQAAEQ